MRRLQWTQVDFDHATLAVTRVKHGTPSTHPLTGRELRALRRLYRETENKSPFLFLSERGSPMTASNFQKLINRACEAAGLKIKAHPHMLRQRLRVPPSECRPGHTLAASLSGPQKHPTHRPIHRAGPDPVQGLGGRIKDETKSRKHRRWFGVARIFRPLGAMLPASNRSRRAQSRTTRTPGAA